MKCSVCGNHIFLEDSFGKDDFVVCRECFEKRVQEIIQKTGWSRYAASVEAFNEIMKKSS